MGPLDDGEPAFAAGRRQPLALELLPILEREIMTRRLAPDEKLVETDLCTRFGISRSPLRETLRLLEANFLVRRETRRGVRVAPMTLDNLDQIYACRAPLEGLAAATVAAAPWREEAASAMADCVGTMRIAAEAGRIEDCFYANVRLTDILHAQSRNPVLMSLLAQINTSALRYRHLTYFERPAIMSLSMGANLDMIDAIRCGDPARAEAVTRKLVLDAWSLVRETFNRDVV